jgi:hypothetical protein
VAIAAIFAAVNAIPSFPTTVIAAVSAVATTIFATAPALAARETYVTSLLPLPLLRSLLSLPAVATNCCHLCPP